LHCAKNNFAFIKELKDFEMKGGLFDTAISFVLRAFVTVIIDPA